MAHDQRREQKANSRDRQPTNSQPQGSLADAEDSKRVANRLAQRKFRRQRKDYITHLENELALCRAGAGAELARRRKEVAILHKEKAELRELLEQVASSLARVCGVDISIGGTCLRRQPDVLLGPAMPSQTESHGGDDGLVDVVGGGQKEPGPCHSTANENPADHNEEAPVDTMNEGNLDMLDVEANDQTALVSISKENSPDLVMMRGQADGLASRLSPDDQTAMAVELPIQDQLPVDPSMAWAQEAYEAGERCFVQVQDEEQREDSQESIVLPTSQDNQLILTTSDKLMPHFDQVLFAAPGTLRGICRSSGCPGRHNGSEKTQLMSIMLRRQVDEAVGSCLHSEGLDSFESLQAMERTLVTGIVDAILSIQAMATRLLGIHFMCLSGGSAWVVWQIAKTFWVLPRLADSGVIARAAELGFASDLFCDTMPAWLRPTDIQKTFEHSSAIDFIPWARLRELLIMHQDDVAIDDILISILSRELPTGADSDRPMDVNDGQPLTSIRMQFLSTQDRLLRDSFYGSISMFRLSEDCQASSSNCATLLVNSMMASHAPILTAS